METEDRREPSYYSIIPANVRYDKNLTPAAKLLYSEITALSNKRGYCWAGNAYFAELYGISTRSVSRMITSLKRAGHIWVEIDKAVGNERRVYLSASLPDLQQQPLTTNLTGGHDKIVVTPHDKNVVHNNTSKNTTDNNFALDVLTLYYQRLPDCRRYENPTETSRGRAALKGIIARANENDWGREVSPWVDVFDRCARSKFLMSQKWFGLHWIVQKDKLENFLAGEYDNSGNDGPALDADKMSDAQEKRYADLG